MEKSAQLEFAALGITELPEGISALTRREMRFVAGYLQHGQMARAAVEAGYSEESAASIASETLKKPKVAAFYRRCIDQVAGESLNVLRGCFQRYVIFHAKALEAAQTRQEAEAWLVSGFNRTTGRNGKEVTEYELARERAQRDEKHYSSLARAEATLLLRATGKLPEGPAVIIDMIPAAVREHLQELARAGVRVALPETDVLMHGRS